MTPAYDPIQELTIAELDAASRLLKTDIVSAVAADTMNKWQGLAIVAYLLTKRTEPTANLGTFRAMNVRQLSDALGYPADDDDEAGDLGADELGADELVGDELGDELGGDLGARRAAAGWGGDLVGADSAADPWLAVGMAGDSPGAVLSNGHPPEVGAEVGAEVAADPTGPAPG